MNRCSKFGKHPVIRMNYGLNHARDMTVRQANPNDLKRLKVARKRGAKPTFHLKWAKSCANCRQFMPVGTIATFNIKKQIVHRAGCVRKP